MLFHHKCHIIRQPLSRSRVDDYAMAKLMMIAMMTIANWYCHNTVGKVVPLEVGMPGTCVMDGWLDGMNEWQQSYFIGVQYLA